MATIAELVKAEQQAPVETSTTESTVAVDITQQAQEQTQETTQTKEENVSTFAVPTFEETTETTQEQQTQTQEQQPLSLNKIDKKELLKAAGLDDYEIEFINYRKSGGDPLKYIEAKSFDWDKVNDFDVIKNEYKKQFPDFQPEQIDRLIAKKYGFVDGGDETDNADALLLLKADAHTTRQKNKEEQQKFQMPSVQSNNDSNDLQKLIQDAEKQQLEEYQKVKAFYENHDAIKDLLESKRVAVKLGDKGTFNFNLDKPEFLLNVITDSNTWQKVTSTKQGEPDVELLKEIALHAVNRNYNTDLINYGISLGKKMMIEEGQNARRPVGQQPSNEAGKGLVIKGTGTLKQHLNGN